MKPTKQDLEAIGQELIETERHRLSTCVAYVNDPLDKHLAYVLCVWKREDGIPVEWVVWTHNKEDHGFYHGHYIRDLEDAVKCFTDLSGIANVVTGKKLSHQLRS
jgi:hypothetical protein